MNIHPYMHYIKDGAWFAYKFSSGTYENYELFWNQNSPRLWTVYQRGNRICDDYSAFALHSSMSRGSTIDGRTLEELELEATAAEIVDEDIDMTSLI